MAIGDFLQGAGRAGRATAIGALRGRRKALDRAEEERKTATIERQRDVQNQLLQQLRTAQTDELAQLGTERTARREALKAETQAEVSSIRAQLPPDTFRPNATDAHIIKEGGRILEARALENERANRRDVAATLAASRTGTSTASTPEERAETARTAAARADITDAMNAISRIRSTNASRILEDRLSEAELSIAVNEEARSRGFRDEAALITKASGIQTGETRETNRQIGPVFTPPDPLAPQGTGTVLLPDQGVPPVAAARPAARERTAQELWDAAAEELGSVEAATAQLGPRPTS